MFWKRLFPYHVIFHSCMINSTKVTIAIDSQVIWKNFSLEKIVVVDMVSTLSSSINYGPLIIHSVFQFLTIILFSLCEKTQIPTVVLDRRITHDFQIVWYFSDLDLSSAAAELSFMLLIMHHNVQMLMMLSLISTQAVTLSTISKKV